MVERISVSFVCQRCLQPLLLNPSLNNINCHTLAELSLPICSSQDIDLESQTNSLDTFVPAFKLVDSTNGSNGFCLLGKDDSLNSKGHQLKVYAQLFDFLSSNSGIDHPLCEECTDTLLDMMDKELKHTKQDFQEYSDFLKTLDSESNSEEDLEFLTKELNDVSKSKRCNWCTFNNFFP
uniref:Beclin-1-like protein n=1 Tax=Cacopsylla melanoneura TaxID=428564 RepID=A0A8D9EGZ1_9HEMI